MVPVYTQGIKTAEGYLVPPEDIPGCREIKIPVAFDFIAVSSYGDSKVSSGIVRITKDLESSIENREVLN